MTSATVGNYQLLEKLGEGGMGSVFKGVDLMVERPVAIKMLRPEIARQPEIIERFRGEAVALAKLNHPNIATLYSLFREGDEYFMVMEFVMGRTLDAIIRQSSAMPVERAIAIASQVLDAIEHAHSYGILHRDIKPANIMLTASGQVKVTDFGIARVLGTARMTQEGCVCGTLEYLAPERIRGQEGDIRSDLYSMGVVLYEMLSQRLPFQRDSAYELMRAHLEEMPPPFTALGVSSVPRDLEMVVTRALAKHPEERFASAGEFRSALARVQVQPAAEATWVTTDPASIVRAAVRGAVRDSSADALAVPDAVAAPHPAVSPAAALGGRRWRLYAGAGAVVLLVVALVFAWSWHRKRQALEAAKPMPVATEPSAVPVQPPAAPASVPAEQGADVQPAPASSDQGQAAAASTAGSGQAKSGARNSDQEKRKAALRALEKNESSKKSGKDKRSSSLDALKN